LALLKGQGPGSAAIERLGRDDRFLGVIDVPLARNRFQAFGSLKFQA
tara:strand:+ start:787 stop:927 length:141 start_codon:yes stop_codon:yes gene_type:complete